MTYESMIDSINEANQLQMFEYVVESFNVECINEGVMDVLKNLIDKAITFFRKIKDTIIEIVKNFFGKSKTQDKVFEATSNQVKKIPESKIDVQKVSEKFNTINQKVQSQTATTNTNGKSTTNINKPTEPEKIEKTSDEYFKQGKINSPDIEKTQYQNKVLNKANAIKSELYILTINREYIDLLIHYLNKSYDNMQDYTAKINDISNYGFESSYKSLTRWYDEKSGIEKENKIKNDFDEFKNSHNIFNSPQKLNIVTIAPRIIESEYKYVKDIEEISNKYKNNLQKSIDKAEESIKKMRNIEKELIDRDIEDSKKYGFDTGTEYHEQIIRYSAILQNLISSSIRTTRHCYDGIVDIFRRIIQFKSTLIEYNKAILHKGILPGNDVPVN